MNVSNLSASTSAYATDPTQAARGQRMQAFKALDSALQSGDLGAAQTAFASLKAQKRRSTT